MLRNTTLALLAVFGVAASSQAALIASYVKTGEPAPGLVAYDVIVSVGAGSNAVGSVVDLAVTNVHQVWQNAAGVRPTPKEGDASNGVFSLPAWASTDTYLKTLSNTTTSPGYGLAETNDGSNPAGIALEPASPFNAFPGSAGIGTFSSTGAQPTITFLAPQPTSVNLMQVVQKAGDVSVLTMRLVDNFATGFQDVTLSISSDVVIPEPASMSLIGLGMVGCIGFFRRRSA